MQIMKSTETIPILIISCYIIVLFLFFGTCLFYYSYLYLLNQYYERLVLFAESYVGDLETAEDMVQDVFLSLLSRSDFNEVEYSRSYLYSCVKNGCVDYLRKLKVVDPLDIKLFDAVYYVGDFNLLEQEELIRLSLIHI